MKNVILENGALDESQEIYSLESRFNEFNHFFPVPQKYNIGKEFIEQRYFAGGKSQQEIASELGMSQWVISQRMKEYGLKTKERTWKLGKRKYHVNDDFFDELNPTNAWVLGWLASDGSININGNGLRFGINVAIIDKDIIQKIKKVLEYNGPVYHVSRTLNKTGKEYNQIILKISSKKIVNRLDDFGIVKNKTLTIGFPRLISESQNEEIIKSFILGVFEGDGSVLFDEKTKSPCFQIVGTKELLEGIQQQLIKYLPLKRTKLTRNTKLSNHFALRYRGRFQAMRIFDWLYSDANNYLNRKHEKYLEIKRRLQ